MESAYGIGIANRYAAFIDNEDDASSIDPYALLTNAADADSSKLASGVKTGGPATAAAPGGKPGGAKGPTGGGPGGKPGQQRQQQQQQHGSFGDAGALSESKANVAANQKDAGRQQKGSRTGGNPNQRPVRGDQENRTQRSPRVNNASFGSPTFGEGQDGELKPSGGRDFRDGGKDRRNGFEGGRGGGGRRGGPGGGLGGPRGGGGGARFGGGKRDFNRHSGSDKTGIKATEKRDGAGAHNWGKPLDDFGAAPEDELAMNGGSAEHAGAEPTGAEGGEAGPGAEGGEEGGKLGEDGEPKVDDEPVVKTLDEYKREREEKRLHTQFNTRKANEGEDKSKWKKTYVLKKKEKTDEEEVEYEEIEVEEDPNKRRGRQVLDIEINFRPSDEGRDFTRRGGPGGRGGRGGPRTPRPDGGERRGGGEGGERGERGPPGEDRRRGPPRGEGGPGGPGGAEGGGRAPRGGAGGGRPDRGSGRGGGRGGQGGGRFQAAPKFDDLNDFPSL